MPLLLITQWWVQGVFDSTSLHLTSQFDLLFWILKSETINSSCLVLNSEGSEHLVHMVMREAIDRGTTSARQSGGSTIYLFASLICEPSWSPEHQDLQLHRAGSALEHSLWLPDSQGFTPHLLQVPVVLRLAVPRNSSVASKGDDCKPGISIIYAPHANKHAYAIHTPSVLIVTEQHVFSTRARHLLRLFRVTERCSDALLLFADSSMCWGEREWFLLGQKRNYSDIQTWQVLSLDSCVQPKKEGRSRSWSCCVF